MIRALLIAPAALALASASCQPPAADPPESAAPLIGRIQFKDRVVDLNVDSFADSPHAIPASSYARIMADVDMPAKAQDATGRPSADTPPERGRVQRAR